MPRVPSGASHGPAMTRSQLLGLVAMSTRSSRDAAPSLARLSSP